MSSVRGLAVRVCEVAPRVHLVIHSADILRTKRVDTSEGLEASCPLQEVG